MEHIELKINFDTEQQKLNEKRMKLRADIAAIDQTLIEQVCEHPEIAIAKKISKKPPIIEVTAFGFLCKFLPEAKGQRKPLYIEPKTLNQLLNGKLLSNKEKRNILKKLYPRIEEILDPLEQVPGSE